MKSLKNYLYNEDGSKKTVSLTLYTKGNLWYRTSDGFEFPVPVSDAGDGIFLSHDSAPMFMRYIRKHLEFIVNAAK